MNWALFIVTAPNPEEDLVPGMSGVMKTSIKPGISDAPFGVLYIVPGSWINDHYDTRFIPPEDLKERILAYYK